MATEAHTKAPKQERDTKPKRSKEGVPLATIGPLEHAAIKDLTPNPRNPNVHTQRTLEAIDASLSEFGQVEPVLVQRGTGIIIAGHGRVKRLRALGADHVEIRQIDIDDLSRDRLMTGLNRSGQLSNTDETMIASILNDGLAKDFPVGIPGYSDRDVDEILREQAFHENVDKGGDDAYDLTVFDEQQVAQLEAQQTAEEQAADEANEQLEEEETKRMQSLRCPKCGHRFSAQES